MHPPARRFPRAPCSNIRGVRQLLRGRPLPPFKQRERQQHRVPELLGRGRGGRLYALPLEHVRRRHGVADAIADVHALPRRFAIVDGDGNGYVHGLCVNVGVGNGLRDDNAVCVVHCVAIGYRLRDWLRCCRPGLRRKHTRALRRGRPVRHVGTV